MTTPSSLGYRMPAEWEPHEATWLAWPHNRTDWPGRFQPVPWVYAEIIRNLAPAERVHLLVSDRNEEKAARRILRKAGALSAAVEFHYWPTNRVWTRDYGPIFLVNAGGARKSASPQTRVALVNFAFNAWAKYPDFGHDNKVPGRVAGLLQMTQFHAQVHRRPLVLEGGAIDVNGCGTLLATEECLLSDVQQRNPRLTRRQYEKAFLDFLNVRHVIWLERGIAGDDTHGHIDDITRFVAPSTVVTATERDTSDENYEPLMRNLARLQAARDQDGSQFTVIQLPMPRPVIFAGQRLPASYLNFYIANGVVLVPVFNDANDRIALNTLAEAMPGHEIIPIYCGDFIWGLGAIHCATQQQPAGVAVGDDVPL
ncbi:MAG: agmatine deiminase family protein [Acidobacteria bacterium]|nr:agmatine deiminase family protein [Acidobacteriota bacterium]